jgi:hypothetical protein
LCFDDIGDVQEGALEGFDYLPGALHEIDPDEYLEGPLDRFGVDDRSIAAYHPSAFQLPDTPQGRRRAQPDRAGQLEVGHPAVLLELAQDVAIDRIHSETC